MICNRIKFIFNPYFLSHIVPVKHHCCPTSYSLGPDHRVQIQTNRQELQRDSNSAAKQTQEYVYIKVLKHLFVLKRDRYLLDVVSFQYKTLLIQSVIKLKYIIRMLKNIFVYLEVANVQVN